MPTITALPRAEMPPITYTSDQPKDYAMALSACASVDELLTMLQAWELLAADALTVAKRMSTNEWAEFRRGLKSERRGKFAGEDWAAKYGAILLPEIMFKVGMVASKYCVPFGLAYIRMRDTGSLPKRSKSDALPEGEQGCQKLIKP